MQKGVEVEVLEDVSAVHRAEIQVETTVLGIVSERAEVNSNLLELTLSLPRSPKGALALGSIGG